MPFWFFLSYARDDSDTYLRKFFEDLCKETALRERLLDGEIGFFDTEAIQTGDFWQENLERALGTSRVLIGLCSPAYVNSEYCGKEFQAFRERVDSYVRQKRPAEAPRLILPILWGPPNDAFPDAIKELQYTDHQFPPIYEQEGLRYLMKLSEFKDDYEKFVTRLAQKVVDAGRKHPLPRRQSLRPLASLKSAFRREARQAAGPKPASLGGFEDARFVYVAASPKELEGVRSRVDLYGERGRSWRPYLPDVEEPIGVIAQEVASKQKLFYDEIPLDDDLIDRLREAEKNREIVVILLDAWTLRIGSYKGMMQPFDRENFLNCALLIPWNDKDQETLGQRAELEKAVKSTFRFKAELKSSTYYKDSIRSAKELRSKLLKTMTEIRMKMIELGEPERTIEAEQIVEEARAKGIVIEVQPIVSGPGGGPA